ncbi:hypothetical protein PUP66_16080 [Pseudomonas chlororaphis]|uniref:hypothetical protein n=1 Tax=Pseudomonas chlororaphis TaxID=587753 RepID=UPI0013B4052D|nr:hypothetical protein [Pseudomonas chlororaphis]WDH44642.1 hypothetical protein PUP66_16080 [Pseudomonas chlororaphis]WDH56489.1 hypothetical protein PUP56_16085 [Pseudomonas chlororaphis]WQE21448.1 hypothetical protein U0007_14895 [Pseudomonas chlororaphis]
MEFRPLGALVKGAHSWRYVEYLTSQPWFYVMALEHVEGIARPATLLIKALDDLLELEGVDNDAWEITRVHLVSPGHLNGTEDWKMERLKEIAKIKSMRIPGTVPAELEQRVVPPGVWALPGDRFLWRVLPDPQHPNRR